MQEAEIEKLLATINIKEWQEKYYFKLEQLGEFFNKHYLPEGDGEIKEVIAISKIAPKQYESAYKAIRDFYLAGKLTTPECIELTRGLEEKCLEFSSFASVFAPSLTAEFSFCNAILAHDYNGEWCFL